MKLLRYPSLAVLGVFACATAFSAVDFHDHIGLQLWSLRDIAKKDQVAALDQIKAFGLTEIETAGISSIPADQYLKLAQARGLVPIGAHFGYEQLTQDLPLALKNAQTLKVKYVVVPWIPHKGDSLSAAEAHQAAASFEKWGAAFNAVGVHFAYHPHGYEFVPNIENGKTAFDILIGETTAKNVKLEMDVFWVYHAEQDPVAMLKKYPDRWVLMHVKDLRKGAPRDVTHGATSPATDNVAVGSGEIDWKAVLSTAQNVGVKHYFIEDETPDALANIPLSVAYLRALKL
ncbi:MAG TPA: sugar phosphate isomerase/epimerase [Candidatus Didemnitutus sp.]|nr:sugar phosphate isomerase/epimerase [Candidatus Didemnitutus sp.]